MTTPVAPPRIIPNAYQMTLRLTQSGQTAAVVLGAMTISGGLLTDAECASWRNSAWAAFRPLCTSDVICGGATVRYLDGSERVLELTAPPSSEGGAVGAAGLAAASTLIKWSTNRGGRSGKGRTFLPGLPAGQLTNGGRGYTGGHATAVATAVTSYLQAAPFTAGAHKPAVLSFTKQDASAITGGALAAVVGVQRRRMR